MNFHKFNPTIKNFKKMKRTILFFTLLALVAFSSCDKDGLKKDNYDKDKLEKDGKDTKDDDKDKEVCFELVYPVSYTMPDGSSITGDNEYELWSAIKSWYEAHPDIAAKPTINYPVDIVWKDGATYPISNEDEMIKLKKKCYDKDKKECFELVYPVTYAMPDGSSVTGDNEDELWAAIKTWYEVHPDVAAKPSLNYPVDIVWKDGVTYPIANVDEMIELKKKCDEKDKKECFELVYPVTYTMPDESTIIGNSKEELWSAIKAWYEVHSDVAAKPSLNYPVNIVFANSDEIVTITNKDEMIATKEACED